MRVRGVLVLFGLSLLACSKPSSEASKKSSSTEKAADDDDGKSEKKSKHTKDKAKKAGDDDDDKSSTKPEKKTASKDHVIEGVGAVPPWAPEAASKKCKAPAGAAAALAKFEKGDDDDITAGKGDPAALAKDLAAGCGTAERALATSLNDGGMKHYGKKAWQEANRWWEVALTIRPAFILARYNLACGLALDGKGKDALRELGELARAAKADDPDAANLLEKARTDDDLKSLRDEVEFKSAIDSTGGTLIGPRREPETAAAGVKLLPKSYFSAMNPNIEAVVDYKPAIENVWSWKPEEGVDLVVATVVSDPATAHKPKGDMNVDYGAIAVYRRDGDKLKLLVAKKTGESPPTAISAKKATLTYKFTLMCGDLKGNLTYSKGKVSVAQDGCGSLDDSPKEVKCGAGQMDVEGACKKTCEKDEDCGKGMYCQVYRVPNPYGGTSYGGSYCETE